MLPVACKSAATRTALAFSASALALAATAPAHAQVEDIVVTAQRVEQRIQDVPISISAVTGDALERAGAKSLEDITSIVPSVTFRKGTTNANSAIVMRGVGTISFSVAAEKLIASKCCAARRVRCSARTRPPAW
jgi:iron complex outermembrane receptor protein